MSDLGRFEAWLRVRSACCDAWRIWVGGKHPWRCCRCGRLEGQSGDSFVYKPVDSAVPVPSQERHTDEVVFRLSPRLARMLERLAEDEQTSVSEIVREALAVRWGLK